MASFARATLELLTDHGRRWVVVQAFLPAARVGDQRVIFIDGEVVGQTAHTFEWSDWRNGEIWWIQSVYVHPLHRGFGVFRALFSHVRELGEADADCCGIRLYMERENDTARESYRRLGFSETGYEVFELLFSALRPPQ